MHPIGIAAALVVGLVLSALAQDVSGSTVSLFPIIENVDSASFLPMASCGNFKLEEATIDEMQTAMEAGTLTAVQLATCYLIRMYQTDDYIK